MKGQTFAAPTRRRLGWRRGCCAGVVAGTDGGGGGGGGAAWDRVLRRGCMVGCTVPVPMRAAPRCVDPACCRRVPAPPPLAADVAAAAAMADARNDRRGSEGGGGGWPAACTALPFRFTAAPRGAAAGDAESDSGDASVVAPLAAEAAAERVDRRGTGVGAMAGPWANCRNFLTSDKAVDTTTRPGVAVRRPLAATPRVPAPEPPPVRRCTFGCTCEEADSYRSRCRWYSRANSSGFVPVVLPPARCSRLRSTATNRASRRVEFSRSM